MFTLETQADHTFEKERDMKILVAEHNAINADKIVALCEKNGLRADYILDKGEIESYLLSQRYDGLIMNTSILEPDPVQLVRLLRNQNMTLPILILSPDHDIDLCLSLLDAGADDFLRMPYNPAEMICRIRAMLRRKDSFLPDISRYYGLCYNHATHELIYEQNHFQLAKKESQIMELLIRNPKQIITTEQLISQLWPTDANVHPNNLWVYISNLRKKIDALTAPISIKAIRGLGYCITTTDCKCTYDQIRT